jgi:GH24 family phage-related lysozyme (muramidase)
MKTSHQGIELNKHFESKHDGNLTEIGLQPKMCPAGIWTVGWGHALRDEKGKWLKGNENKALAYLQYPNLTDEEAEELLIEDLTFREAQVNSLHIDFKQNEFDALVSFVYNVGFANLLKSSLLKRIQANKKGILNYGSSERIKQAFMMWNKAKVNGVLKELKGLTKRRNTEAKLYLTGILNFNDHESI